MGQNQTFVNEVNAIQQPTQQSIQILTAMNMLQMQQIQKIDDHNCTLGGNNDNNKHFNLKTMRSIGDLKNINGYIEITNDKNIKIFEGQIENSYCQNYGIQYGQKNKILYEGLYHNNRYEGWGITSTYEGQFQNGHKNGWGIYKNQGTYYEGFWKDDYYHGLGTLNIKSSQIQQFLKQNFNIECKTDQYIGEWSLGKMSGMGKKSTPKQIYTGYFNEGYYEGQGKLFKDNKIYFGKFYQGEKIK